MVAHMSFNEKLNFGRESYWTASDFLSRLKNLMVTAYQAGP